MSTNDVRSTTRLLRTHWYPLAGALLAALWVAGVAYAGAWVSTGSMSVPRTLHSATRLLDGRVLVAGGASSPLAPHATAELYDPATGAWSAAASMAVARSRHTATLLPDGRVLVAGGETSVGGTRAAEIFDPAGNAWAPTGSLHVLRSNHTATLLANGRVLVTGGVSSSDKGMPVEKSAEIYDPATGAWALVDRMAVARYNHSATLLPDGRVLVAGGVTPNNFHVPTRTAEIYDPVADRWQNIRPMAEARFTHLAFLLPGGRVLVAGGWTQPPNALTPTGTAEIFDSTTGQWAATDSLNVARGAIARSAVQLSDGRVVVTGGSNGVSSQTLTEIYDPVSGAWQADGYLVQGRSGGLSVTLLADARVLAAGGPNLASAELYAGP